MLLKSPKIDFDKINRFVNIFPDDVSFGHIRKELAIVVSHLESTKDKDFRKHLKNYVIIRLVTHIEVYLQNLVVRLIDDYDFKYNKLFKDENVVISLSSFDKIKNLTKGKIIATSLKFQSSSEINESLTALLGGGFLDMLKKSVIADPNPFVQNWDKFFEIFKVRHKIVHTLDYAETFGKKQIENIVEAAEWFTVITNIIVFEQIFWMDEAKLQKNLPNIYSWMLDNHLSEQEEPNIDALSE